MQPTPAPQMAFIPTETTTVLPAPQLATYTDFREYLKHCYDHRRASEGTALRPYSYSNFSAAADIKSPNYLKLIIDGRRNLSEDMSGKFARALRLNREQAEEFKALVRYGQAADPMERNRFLRELSDLRARRDLQAGRIDASAWEKIPSWIGWVLYAMADQEGVSFDPARLHQLFRAKASVEDIRQSLAKLIAAGRLRQEADGQIVKGDAQETGSDLPVNLIRNLQAELIYLGIESLFRDSPKDREFGALTVSMTPEEFEQTKFELRQMRKRLHKDTSVKRQSQKGERVYQLNIQLFPVTNKA